MSFVAAEIWERGERWEIHLPKTRFDHCLNFRSSQKQTSPDIDLLRMRWCSLLSIRTLTTCVSVLLGHPVPLMGYLTFLCANMVRFRHALRLINGFLIQFLVKTCRFTSFAQFPPLLSCWRLIENSCGWYLATRERQASVIHWRATGKHLTWTLQSKSLFYPSLGHGNRPSWSCPYPNQPSR